MVGDGWVLGGWMIPLQVYVVVVRLYYCTRMVGDGWVAGGWVVLLPACCTAITPVTVVHGTQFRRMG